MPTQTTIHRRPQSRPMLFVDCPFCLEPLAVDPETGSSQCLTCGVHLEIAPEPPLDATRLPVAA